MDQQFQLKLTKTSTVARIMGFVANLGLFIGFGWALNHRWPTGQLLAVMVPTALVVNLLARRWLVDAAVATVEPTRLLVQRQGTEELTIIAFAEVASFSLEQSRNTKELRFMLTDGTTQKLDGGTSADDTFAEFVRALAHAAAQYQARHPARMVRGDGFAGTVGPAA